MNISSTWYRGVQLIRVNLDAVPWSTRWLCGGGGWTELWLAGKNSDRIMTWNEACAFADLVELEPPEKDQPFYCSECGQRDLLCWMDSKRDLLLSRKLCFDCSHWFDWVQFIANESHKRVVIDGRCYTVEPDRGSANAGFGGSRFDIEWPDGRRVTTRNLWHAGAVPDHWRARLPDTARFVTDDPLVFEVPA